MEEMPERATEGSALRMDSQAIDLVCTELIKKQNMQVMMTKNRLELVSQSQRKRAGPETEEKTRETEREREKENSRRHTQLEGNKNNQHKLEKCRVHHKFSVCLLIFLSAGQT